MTEITVYVDELKDLPSEGFQYFYRVLLKEKGLEVKSISLKPIGKVTHTYDAQEMCYKIKQEIKL